LRNVLILYTETPDTTTQKTHLLGYFHPQKYDTTKNVFSSNDNSQTLSLDNTKTPKMALQTDLFCTTQNNIAKKTMDLKKIQSKTDCSIFDPTSQNQTCLKTTKQIVQINLNE
jgi:hypothetical protein